MTWAALAVTLTALGSLYTWWSFRHHGLAAGLRGVALTLLVPAAWLTGTLALITRISTALSWWATHLVLSPAVWIGIGAACTSALLFVVARGVDRRRPVGRPQPGSLPAGEATAAVPGGSRSRKPTPRGPQDDEFADIEELLRRRGIS